MPASALVTRKVAATMLEQVRNGVDTGLSGTRLAIPTNCSRRALR
jgi:hypothetical protein